ncbi:MAG: hypothetical protein KJ941_08700 [Bacteroidetes bacterium]|nr:hypothetical protein [Bacteroidota bacterium]
MDQTKSTQLINSTFDSAEAKELVMDLLNTKINFHKLKNFSSNVRFGRDDQYSLKRAAHLELEQLELLRFLEEAYTKNLTIEINSSIHLKIID